MPAVLAFLLVAVALAAQPRVSIRSDGVQLIDGKPVFPIGFTKAPPADGKTPEGRDAYAELRGAGTVFHRTGPAKGQWGPETEATLDHILERSAAAGIFGAITLPDLQALGPEDKAKEAELRRVVTKYRGHPGLFCWKGEDEPEWGKVPVDRVQRFYDIVRELDANHPVWITQAPRGAIESLKRYDPAYDIAALDIYPISYPPGVHSHLPNKNISVVGDYARWMREITGGRKPFWMVLQIAFSGVIKPGRTLRFPTLPEERYMTYQSIINGARGLIYFGGDLAVALNDRDSKLGWNWTFYYRVLKPVLEELAPDGPLYPALIAPESKLAVKMEGAADVEFCAREAGPHLFILAAKREGSTVQVKFSGLPASVTGGDVLFEEPRKVAVSGGGFSDWFGPNEVHVYRFLK
ncbi:MAG: hypothetical protein AAB225_06050 [Acidobacteriota bacterium]